MKALDFRIVLDWLPNPLCSHGRPPPCCGHSFVKDICGRKRKPFGPNCGGSSGTQSNERDPILDHQAQAPNLKKSIGTSCRATDGKTERSCRAGAAAHASAEKQILQHGAKESIRAEEAEVE